MNEQTAMLADTVDRLFADAFSGIATGDASKFDAALWAKVSDLGLPLLMVPERVGGIGAGWFDAMVVMEALGRYAVPLPLAETLLAARLLGEAEHDLPDGPMSVAVKVSNGWLTKGEDGAWHFDGELSGVPWGRSADTIVACVGTRLAVVKRADARAIVEAVNLAGEPRDRLTYQQAPCVVIDGVASEHVFDCAALLRLGQVSGALAAALQRSIDYAGQRKQFGKPIGKFQSVQQQLAVLGEEAAAAACAASQAALAADRGDASFEIAAARLRQAQAIEIGCATSHQVHGAIGFTREYDLRHFTQRLMSWRSEYGNDRWWAERLGGEVAARGAENFWADLTARGDKAVG